MKKRFLFFGFFAFLMIISFQSQAQGTISVNAGGEEVKTVSKARSIALTNTVLSVGTGVATVALFDNNTVETAGAILGVYGIIMGPSTGNFYANDNARGAIGMGARAVGAYLMADATSEIFGREFANTLKVDNRDVSLTDTKILIGEILILGSIVYNVLSTKASVEAYNQGRRGFSMNVMPTIIDNEVAPMVTASIRF